MAPNPNPARPGKRDWAQAAADFYESHAPLATEFPVTGAGVVCEVYAAGRDFIRVMVGTTDGKALADTFSLQVESTLRPGRPGKTPGEGKVVWSARAVDADYAAEGVALVALLDDTIVTGPVNRVRVRCTAFTGSSGNLAVWVL